MSLPSICFDENKSMCINSYYIIYISLFILVCYFVYCKTTNNKKDEQNDNIFKIIAKEAKQEHKRRYVNESR